MNRILLPLLVIVGNLCAQTNISGIVNLYTAITFINTTGPCGSGQTDITVASTTGFLVNDRVLIIQMKGAVADQTSSNNFGDITMLGQAGNYEFATITGISGSIIITNPLITPFNTSEKVQLIRVPVYSAALVNGTLTGQAWNGTTGGVLAIEVAGTLTLNAPIDMSGKGYMGAFVINNGPKGCDYYNYYYDETGVVAIDDQKRAAYKGEGIAEFIAQKKMGKGKWTTGGGGGNAHNAGGGGGGNVGAGGRGGRQYDGCSSSGGHGIGGTTVNATSSKLFMGGAGGAGDEDDNYGTRGGNGGGIILISASTIVGNGYGIYANGENAPNSMSGGASGTDGMGGGGAAGTIALECTNFIGTLNLLANGGNGSSSDPSGGTWSYHGPGGGAGGGLIWISPSSMPSGITSITLGGVAGYTRNHDASRSHWEATDGNPGATSYNFARNQANCIPLPASIIDIHATLENNEVHLQWFCPSLQSAGFTIQRKCLNGEWEDIKQLNIFPNQEQSNWYHYFDSQPCEGVSYYRIIETQLDGKTLASELVSVTKSEIEILISQKPNESALTIKNVGIYSDIQVINSLGQEIDSQSIPQTEELLMDLSHFPPGTYFLIFQSESKNTCRKIVIQ